MKGKIREILEDLGVDVDYDTCTSLVTGRHLSSLEVLSLVLELEETFSIMIPAVDIVASNFDSVDAIADLITQIRAEEQKLDWLGHVG